MPNYRHTQIGTLLLTMLGAAILIVGAILLARGSDKVLLLVLLILVVTAGLFALLTNGQQLRIGTDEPERLCQAIAYARTSVLLGSNRNEPAALQHTIQGASRPTMASTALAQSPAC